MHIRGVDQVRPRFTIWSVKSNLGAFQDIEGDFDNTSFEAIGRACADHEVHFTISRWIAARLSNPG
jgi:hypothetical protein